MKTILVTLFVLFLSGCQLVRKLPPVKASEIHSTTSVFGVQQTADAYDVSNTPTTLKAKDAKFTLSWPGFYHETSVKDFEQKLPKDLP